MSENLSDVLKQLKIAAQKDQTQQINEEILQKKEKYLLNKKRLISDKNLENYLTVLSRNNFNHERIKDIKKGITSPANSAQEQEIKEIKNQIAADETFLKTMDQRLKEVKAWSENGALYRDILLLNYFKPNPLSNHEKLSLLMTKYHKRKYSLSTYYRDFQRAKDIFANTEPSF